MKRRKLDNKGFAISVVLYTSISIMVLIFILLLSIMSTDSKNTDYLVNSIKEMVSGVSEPTKAKNEIGNINIVPSDGIASGKWHANPVTLSFVREQESAGSVPINYYYGTVETNIKTKAENNQLVLNTDSTGTTYYVRACKVSDATDCTAVESYVFRLDTKNPTLSVTGGATTFATSRTFNLTVTAASGVDRYEYFVTDTKQAPTAADAHRIMPFYTSNITISDTGFYVYFRVVNKLGRSSAWQVHNLYVAS